MTDPIANSIVNTAGGLARTYIGWQGMMRDMEDDRVKKLADQYTVNRVSNPEWKPDPNAEGYSPTADYRSQVQATYKKIQDYQVSDAGRKDEVGKFDQEMQQVANVARQANALAVNDPEAAKALYRKLNNEVVYNGFTVSEPDEKGQISIKNSDTGSVQVMPDLPIEKYQEMVSEYLSDPKSALALRQARRTAIRENNMKALMNPQPVFNDKGDMLIRVDAQDPKSGQYTPYFTDMQGQRVDGEAAQGYFDEKTWQSKGSVEKLAPGLQKRIQVENVDELLKAEPVFNDKGEILFRVKRKNDKGEAEFYFIDKNAKPVRPDQAQGFMPKSAWDQQAGVTEDQKKIAGAKDAEQTAKNWQDSMKAATNAWQKERSADASLDPEQMWDWIDNFATDYFKKTYPGSKMPEGIKPTKKNKTGWHPYDPGEGDQMISAHSPQPSPPEGEGVALASAAAPSSGTAPQKNAPSVAAAVKKDAKTGFDKPVAQSLADILNSAQKYYQKGLTSEEAVEAEYRRKKNK